MTRALDDVTIRLELRVSAARAADPATAERLRCVAGALVAGALHAPATGGASDKPQTERAR